MENSPCTMHKSKWTWPLLHWSLAEENQITKPGKSQTAVPSDKDTILTSHKFNFRVQCDSDSSGRQVSYREKNLFVTLFELERSYQVPSKEGFYCLKLSYPRTLISGNKHRSGRFGWTCHCLWVKEGPKRQLEFRRAGWRNDKPADTYIKGLLQAGVCTRERRLE